jgi:hypothetical protein
MNLMSSTLLTEDTGVPFDELQAEQIQLDRDAWRAAGHEREPRVSVSRSILPLIDDETRYYFGLRAQADPKDQVGWLDGGNAPNQLGVEFNTRILESIVNDIRPSLG